MPSLVLQGLGTRPEGWDEGEGENWRGEELAAARRQARRKKNIFMLVSFLWINNNCQLGWDVVAFILSM